MVTEMFENKMKILIATHKRWNIERAYKLIANEHTHIIKVITKKEELTEEMLEDFAPNYVFFPHWSYYIPANIYEKWECIVFHMTDLPYGRGGSPLQNLIVRGVKETKISAIKVVDELDAGAVYLKEDLSLDGAAHEIYDRASKIIFEKMIPKILNEKIIPQEQMGKIVTFKRRNKSDSELFPNMPIEKIYDYIRMLDAEGYPNAYIKFGENKLEFYDAYYDGKNVEARVIIHKEEM